MVTTIARVAKNTAISVVFTFLKLIQDMLTRVLFGYEKVTTKESFYELVDKNMKKEDVPISLFKGSVLLIVNVASK